MALKFVSAEEAAYFIKNGYTVGISGFTHTGCPKVVSGEIAKIAEQEHSKGNPFKINIVAGASTGDKFDGVLTRAEAINFRTPFQTIPVTRKAINKGDIKFCDIHISPMAQEVRLGYYGQIDVAIIEACDVTEDGEIILTCGVGISPTIARLAKLVIVELNRWNPKEIRGMHDIAELIDPPHRKQIDIYKEQDRIGQEFIKIDPNKIIVVETNEPNEGDNFVEIDEVTSQIGKNVADFFVKEMNEGRMPKTFLPIQSGVGNIANAVLAAMGDNENIPDFMVYTEIVQDAVIDLIEKGRIKYASACALTVSNSRIQSVYKNLDFFKKKIVLRPSEYSNSNELIRRLGVISINTAVEADIFGNVNSTHIMGTKMMNGVGGSADYTRSAYVSLFVTPSTTKEGKISCFVPFVTHEDHSEHSVKIIVTEYGVADLRGKKPKDRALEIIHKCAHPDYRPLLLEYLENAPEGHTPMDIYNCHAFHKAFLETGDMHNVKWIKR